MNVTKGLTFDDVLLVPKHSKISSRKLINLDLNLSNDVKLNIPVVSANMKNVTEAEMATAISNQGGLALLHRFCSIEKQIKMFTESTQGGQQNVGCSVGVGKEDSEKADLLYDKGCKIFCVDVAHGDHENCCRTTNYLANKFDDCLIISGNVCTGEGAKRLFNSGAKVIKVGVGPGSLCTTRIDTGNGYPQLTALESVFNESRSWNYALKHERNRKFKIIADGGIRNGGDIIKALCFSDSVMLGSLLAGTDEAPGNIIKLDGKTYKEYAGSSTHKNNYIEGVKAIVPIKGPVTSIITRLMEGLRSGLSYQGCTDLEELKVHPEFVSISNAGLIESRPHDVIISS
jgi:IMP dehydrogenase